MDMQNLLNKLNGLLAEETSNPEPEQLSLDLYQNVDMAGEPCIRCEKGHYTETSIHDDWDGVQHCSNCNHQIKRHLTTDELNELKKSVRESDEAGSIKQCVSCGEKAHVDHTTGMCVDCLTKAEEEQGLSESPMGRATADTKMKTKKCAFCGGNIVGRGKTTEKGDTICKDCDDYYAFDGPGGEEPGISESPMGRRAPAEPHTCETCGRSMSNWEPGDGAECDECAEGMSPEDSNPDELDEAKQGKKLIKTYKSIDGKEFQLYSDPKTGYNTLMFGNDEVDEWYDHVPTDSAIDTIIDGYLDNLYSDKELDEAAMCEDCGEQPCVCETDQLEEAKVKNYYAVATAAIKKKYDLGPGKVDLTDAQTAEAHKLAKKLKKDDQKLKESEQDGSAELGQLKRMMECWGPMAAPQASGMNVTTNVDSKTGNKTVTVTADGEGAEDLMQILAMAGIAITPAPVAATPVGEQVANEPAPQTLDAQTQLVDMAGGPNAPHAQYNPDRARDNSMAIVDEAVNRLASKLRAKFFKESQGSKSKKISKSKKSDPYTDSDGYPKSTPYGWKPASERSEEDEGYPVSRKSKKSDPYTDSDGYPKSTPYGWKPASERSEEDDWLH